MPRLTEKTESAPNTLSVIDFGIEVFKEKIPDNGEDSYLYMFNPNSCVVGVFDGCGGSGAKKYEKYRGKTGAYMASRVVSAATRDWFIELKNGNPANSQSALKERIKEYLSLCREIGGGTTTFKGSMSKDFPTTAAVLVMFVDGHKIHVTCLWAGDSRCYLLDSEGLKQLTEDDLGGLDAMENLTADGVLTNVISSSKDFTLHQKTFTIAKPTILFSATDGCFGYFSTPMEFENLLLSTLRSSNNVEEWEKKIADVLQEVAGDDYSLSGFALGYASFSNLKEAFRNRYSELFNKYINGLNEKTQEEKMILWSAYKPSYTLYLYMA